MVRWTARLAEGDSLIVKRGALGHFNYNMPEIVPQTTEAYEVGDHIKRGLSLQIKTAGLVIAIMTSWLLDTVQASLPGWSNVYPQSSNCDWVLDIIGERLWGLENYTIDIFSPENELRHWTFCVIRDKDTDVFVIVKIFENSTLEEAWEVLSWGNVTLNGQPYILGEAEKEQLFKFLEWFYNKHMRRLSKWK